MQTTLRRSLAFLALVFGLAASLREARASVYPAPIALPTGSYAGQAVIANGINGRGQIVGAADYGVPLFWASPTSAPVALGYAGFDSAIAQAINDAGQIVGSGVRAGSEVPLYWASPSSSPIALQSPADNEQAYGINDAGQIVGGNGTAFFWASPTSAPTLLAGETCMDMDAYVGCSAQAYGINSSGSVVGYGNDDTGSHPAIWQSSTTPFTFFSGSFGVARGINDCGAIVGQGPSGPAVWDSAASAPSSLSFAGYASAAANGISSDGQIVGVGFARSASTTDPFPRFVQVPLLWSSHPSPPQMLENLLSSTLMTNLSAQIQNQLDAKLNAAIATLEAARKNDQSTAANQIGAFVNATLGDLSAGRLTSCQAQQLVDAANAILSALGQGAAPAAPRCSPPPPTCN